MKLSEAIKRIKPAKCIRTTAKGVTEIDVVNSSYSIINELFLQDNRITSLKNISQFPNLTRIALENNAISNIEELEELRFLPKLREIRLKGNPICNIPLFNQQVANFFNDYIIIDSKRVHFSKNKAKYENNIVFAIFISNFFTKIPKKPRIDILLNQLNIFLKKNDFVNFAHKLRYSYLKCDDKTYFIHLKQVCTQKIHNNCEKCGNFENLSNFLSKFYYSKVSYLAANDIKKLKFPFFNNLSNETNNISSESQIPEPLFPFADVKNFYSCCCFKGKRVNIPKVQNINKSKKFTTDEKSTIAIDLEIESQDILTEDINTNELTISNSYFPSSGNNQNSESSVRKVILKNDSKRWLSMPAIESDFSNFSAQRAVVFSEPFNISVDNDQNSIKKLSIEESAEFSLINIPAEPLLQENELLEFLNTSSSSSSSNSHQHSRSRRPSTKSVLSTSSSSSPFAITNSPNGSASPPNKQKFSPTSNNNKVKVMKSNTKMNLPSTLSTSSSSLGNVEAGIDENAVPIHENKNEKSSIIKNNNKKDFSKSGVVSPFIITNELSMISENNVAKSENGISALRNNVNESEVDLETEPVITLNEPIKKRKRIRRKKKIFPEDSASEVFED